MSTLDEKILAKKAAKDKKISKRKKKKRADENTGGKQTSESHPDHSANLKQERRMHDLASSGEPKCPPEIQYNLYSDAKQSLPPLPSEDLHGLETPMRRKREDNDKSTTAETPNAQVSYAACNSDRIQAQKLKFGHEKFGDQRTISMPGVYSERSSDYMSTAEEEEETIPSKYPAGSLPGSYSESSSDKSTGERLKMIYNSSDFSMVERSKIGRRKSGKPNDNHLPGAKSEHSSEISNSERLEFCHINTDTSKSMSLPGAYSEHHSDICSAQRSKIIYSAGDKSEGLSICSPLEVSTISRWKSDDMNDDSLPETKSDFSEISASGLNMDDKRPQCLGPSVSEEESEGLSDSSTAERMNFDFMKSNEKTVTTFFAPESGHFSNPECSKFGLSNVDLKSRVEFLPGAKTEWLSAAERSKFDRNSAEHNDASIPRVKSEKNVDTSTAERLKYGRNNSAEMIVSMPGANFELAADVSNAEQLKHGTGPLADGVGVISGTSLDLNAATRLKFNDALSEVTPGASNESSVGTYGAEDLKFGMVHRVPRENSSHDDDSRSSSTEEEGGSRTNEGIQHEPGNQADFGHEEAYCMHTKDIRESFIREDIDVEYGTDPDYRPHINRDQPDEKTVINGWRSCCLIFTCASFVIIIALSAALSAAKKKACCDPAPTIATPEETAMIISETTGSPSLAPTTAPQDFNFCHEANELAALNNVRYSSIRTELINSGVSTSADFSVDSSYQRKSLCWLAFGDRLNVSISDPFLHQRYILATMYFGLNESQKLTDAGWLSGKSECDWKPIVECDPRSNASATILDFYDSGLSGELPKELGNLQDLIVLKLSSNDLEGYVMDTFGNWPHLTTLQLASNRFRKIPSNLNMLPSLEHFDINSNGIQGPIPESLVSVINLLYLDISFNEFNNTIPTTFGELQSLHSLYMHGNELVGSVPDEICALREVNLEHLTVDCTPLSVQVECTTSCCTACGYYDTIIDSSS